jgi:hypothetical protein
MALTAMAPSFTISAPEDVPPQQFEVRNIAAFLLEPNAWRMFEDISVSCDS